MKWRELNSRYANRLEILARRTPYELLEVTTNVDEEELKRAYRTKVSAYHPDKADPFMKVYGQEVAKLINAAYERIRKDRGFDKR